MVSALSAMRSPLANAYTTLRLPARTRLTSKGAKVAWSSARQGHTASVDHGKGPGIKQSTLTPEQHKFLDSAVCLPEISKIAD